MGTEGTGGMDTQWTLHYGLVLGDTFSGNRRSYNLESKQICKMKLKIFFLYGFPFFLSLSIDDLEWLLVSTKKWSHQQNIWLKFGHCPKFKHCQNIFLMAPLFMLTPEAILDHL